MDLIKPITFSSIQEENFFAPPENIFARRITELEAILDFVLDLNQTSSQAVTHRWKYTLRQNGELKRYFSSMRVVYRIQPGRFFK